MADRDDRTDKPEKIWIFERESSRNAAEGRSRDSEAALGPRYSRRDVLKRAGAFGAAAGLAGILAACGGGGDEAAAPPPAEPAPAEPPPAESEPAAEPAPPATTGAAEDIKRGGRLRVGHVGGGDAEGFNPALGSTFIDASRFYNVYDPLTRVNPDFSYSPALALEWTPNADSTEWEIKLRPDVVWHDGKPFTADDVIYTMNLMGDKGHISHASVANVRLGEISKVDDLTLVVPLKSSNARLIDSFVQQNTVIVQDGSTDYTNPIGTGPFKFQEFSVGQRSLCVRNENYWEEGKPYVDEWEDISIDDETARLNALLAGETDMMSQLSFTQARAQQDSGEVQVIDAPSPAVQVILMAVDIAPFDDPLVRQAFRLIPDRQALVDGALQGFGSVGNDLVGAGLPFFSDLPAREQDLEQAKALLAQAGKENLEVTLHTSDIVPGFVEAATLFAEMAKGAGVTVNVKKEAANAYFDTNKLYTHVDFGQSFWTVSSVGLWYEQALLSDAVWNETHWKDPEFDALIRQAQGAPDEATATDLWNQVQQIQYDEGGYIVWANPSIVDAAAQYVKGIVPSAFFNLGGWNYRDVWLDT
jgi:peptide/nickel transport system substrate-binding protein